jgi:hypothetical protein
MMVDVVLPSPDGPNTATIVAIVFFYSLNLFVTAKISIPSEMDILLKISLYNMKRLTKL